VISVSFVISVIVVISVIRVISVISVISVIFVISVISVISVIYVMCAISIISVISLISMISEIYLFLAWWSNIGSVWGHTLLSFERFECQRYLSLQQWLLARYLIPAWVRWERDLNLKWVNMASALCG